MRTNMRVERVRKKLTLKEVAGLLGCCEQLVSRWELGLTTPSAKYLKELTELYNADIVYLLEDDNTQRKESNERHPSI